MNIKFLIIASFIFIIGLSSCIKTEAPQVSPENTQLVNEVNAIDTYLKNDTGSYIVYSSSGVRVVFKNTGDDIPPHNGQILTFAYSAKTFSDSIIFQKDTTISAPLQNISITGLTGWFTSLEKGSISRFYVPSYYAYGTKGSTLVPPNATIVFDVTIIGITKTSAESKQDSIDDAAIQNYFLLQTITGVIPHPSGIYYTIETTGTGINPKPYDNINFAYQGSVITTSTGAAFEANTLYNQNIFNLIDGLKVGIPIMQQGSTYNFYIPSGLGYGTTGSGGIPINSNLKYTITLEAVIK